MLLKETKLALLDLLCAFSEEEKDLESIRQSLCETPCFEPYLAFRRIDTSNSGFLTTSNISNFLSTYNFFHNPQKTQSYISHYDQDFDQKLSYSEFLQSVLPMDNSELRFSISQRPIKRADEFEPIIIEEIEKKLAFLLNREILFYVKFDRPKKHLLKTVEDDILTVFSSLALRNKDEIGFEDLKVFFMKNSYEINDTDIVLMLRRIDLNGDGKIDRNEFEDAFLPKNKYSNQKKNSLLNKKAKQSLEKTKKSQKELNDKREFFSNKSLNNNNNNNNFKSFKNKGVGQQIDEVVELMSFFLKIEKNYEELKQELAMMDDFNLFDLFNVFDKTGKGYVLPSEFEFGLNEMQIYPEKEEMMVFILALNPKNDGKIIFSNFINAFLPKQTEYANILNKRTPKNTDNMSLKEAFLKKTRAMIRRIFDTHFQNEMFLENAKAKLVNSPFFNIEKVFDFIDNDNDGFLSLYDLRRLFEKAGQTLSEKELLILLERFDKDDDSFVSFYEFDMEIQPRINVKT